MASNFLDEQGLAHLLTKLDSKIADDLANYLPKSGGTMTGGISTSVEGILAGKDDTVGLRISGGTGWNNGSSIVVYGKSHDNYAGQFSIKAEDGTNNCVLNGRPDGVLEWGSKIVERVNTISIASDNGYIRYEGGLQICWGYVAGASNFNKTVTFPAAFSAVPGLSVAPGATYSFTAHSINSTSFICYVESTASMEIRYIAIGKWK